MQSRSFYATLRANPTASCIFEPKENPMDHLFLEIMVKEKETAFRQETEFPRLPYPANTTPSPLTARLLDGLGDALIRLGRSLKAKYGMPSGCPKAI